MARSSPTGGSASWSCSTTWCTWPCSARRPPAGWLCLGTWAGLLRRGVRPDLDRVDQRVAVPELHGREDGRTRSIVFVQMGILVLLAVFIADAADGGGRGFAVVYATYQVFQTGLWYSVWLRDRRDRPEFLATTGGYVVGMGMSATVIGASALLPATPRLLMWAGLGGRLDRRHHAGRPPLPRQPGPGAHRLTGRTLRTVHHHRPRRGRDRGRGRLVGGRA